MSNGNPIKLDHAILAKDNKLLNNKRSQDNIISCPWSEAITTQL